MKPTENNFKKHIMKFTAILWCVSKSQKCMEKFFVKDKDITGY